MRSNSSSNALKDITSASECAPCVVILSPDRVRRERAFTYLLHKFAPKEYQPRTFSFLDTRSNPASFLYELSEPSLFESQKFAVCRGLEGAKAADLEPVSAFISKPPKGVHVFLVGSALPNSPRFKKALGSFAKTVALDQLKGAELRRWTERELKNAGVAPITDEIVEIILADSSEDPDAVISLVEKFSLYLDGAPASVAALRQLTPGKAGASDFELAEQLLSGKRAQSEILIHQLLSGGSSPFMLVGLLAKTLTSLARIRALTDRGLSSKHIREELGIPPWLLSKYTPLANRCSLELLNSHINALLRADFKLKDRSLGVATVLSTLAAEISKGAKHG